MSLRTNLSTIQIEFLKATDRREQINKEKEKLDKWQFLHVFSSLDTNFLDLLEQIHHLSNLSTKTILPLSLSTYYTFLYHSHCCA